MPDKELTQGFGSTQDPVQRLAGLRIGRRKLPERRMLFDQPDQGLQGSVRVRRHLQAGKQFVLVQAVQFPGSEEPLALLQVAEAGRDQAAGKAHRRSLEDAEVALQLVGRHLEPVVLPFGTLVAQEVFEHLLAEDLRHQLGLLHGTDGVVEAGGQGVVAHGTALGGAQRPDVVLGGRGQVVTLFDPLQAGPQQDRVRQVGVRGGVNAPVFDPGGLALAGLVQRDPDQGRTVVVAPAEVAGASPPPQRRL